MKAFILKNIHYWKGNLPEHVQRQGNIGLLIRSFIEQENVLWNALISALMMLGLHVFGFLTLPVLLGSFVAMPLLRLSVFLIEKVLDEIFNFVTQGVSNQTLEDLKRALMLTKISLYIGLSAQISDALLFFALEAQVGLLFLGLSFALPKLVFDTIRLIQPNGYLSSVLYWKRRVPQLYQAISKMEYPMSIIDHCDSVINLSADLQNEETFKKILHSMFIIRNRLKLERPEQYKKIPCIKTLLNSVQSHEDYKAFMENFLNIPESQKLYKDLIVKSYEELKNLRRLNQDMFISMHRDFAMLIQKIAKETGESIESINDQELATLHSVLLNKDLVDFYRFDQKCRESIRKDTDVSYAGSPALTPSYNKSLKDKESIYRWYENSQVQRLSLVTP